MHGMGQFAGYSSAYKSRLIVDEPIFDEPLPGPVSVDVGTHGRQRAYEQEQELQKIALTKQRVTDIDFRVLRRVSCGGHTSPQRSWKVETAILSVQGVCIWDWHGASC
jgi:hypothetical protein